MADTITREVGFVAPSSTDWALSETALPLSIMFMMLGVSAAGLGPWQSRVGTRTALLCSSFAFGGGLTLGALGIHLHMLPLVYLGYGVLGGLGLGLAYTPPIQTLINWFPDKKGLASGLTIAGFGSGALVFTPAAQYLMKKFATLPEYLGPKKDFILEHLNGKLYTNYNGNLVEVVEALSSDLAKLPYDLQEGLYLVGSGSTGATEALGILGLTYFTVLFGSSLVLRRPHLSYAPAGTAPVSNTAASGPTLTPAPSPVIDVTMPEAIRSPQFHLLGISFFCMATGGMGIFSVAKPMMSEVSPTFLLSRDPHLDLSLSPGV
jgi:MFS family permease